MYIYIYSESPIFFLACDHLVSFRHLIMANECSQTQSLIYLHKPKTPKNILAIFPAMALSLPHIRLTSSVSAATP